MRSRTHERARAFYYLFHCCFEIPRSRSRFKPSTIASIRREEWACNWKEKEEQGGKKGEGENFFSETKINKERFIRNFKVARKGDRKKERKRGKDCGETISHAFGKGGIADERKGGQRFDGGLLGTVRRPFGSTGSGTTW